MGNWWIGREGGEREKGGSEEKKSATHAIFSVEIMEALAKFCIFIKNKNTSCEIEHFVGTYLLASCVWYFDTYTTEYNKRDVQRYMKKRVMAQVKRWKKEEGLRLL